VKERKKDAPQKFLTEKKEDDRFSVRNSYIALQLVRIEDSARKNQKTNQTPYL
jgi:hypothetical protein